MSESPLQPLGYTLDSVAAGCVHVKQEGLNILRQFEQAGTLLSAESRLKKRGDAVLKQCAGFRERLLVIGLSPDAGSLWKSMPLDHAMAVAQTWETRAEGCVGTLEYLNKHPDAAFHLGFPVRMYKVLARDHQEMLMGDHDISDEVTAALCAADPELFPWFVPMRGLLHLPGYPDGVTWPSHMGNAFGRYERSLQS